VVKEQLTKEMIEAGAHLTQKLDESGLPIPVAMWFFMPDINEWRLFFASPEVSRTGSRDVYRQIEKARKKLGVEAEHVPLSVIGVLDTNHQLAHLLRVALQTGPELSRVRFSKNVINGRFIDDALVYRSAA